mmetsp:Transcript_33184/g.91440  ORF Transcript_33184/g.91440 Transcript_33184/m.91440 type:complete len:487 (+) Transcript_33184:49-1509(+)
MVTHATAVRNAARVDDGRATRAGAAPSDGFALRAGNVFGRLEGPSRTDREVGWSLAGGPQRIREERNYFGADRSRAPPADTQPCIQCKVPQAVGCTAAYVSVLKPSLFARECGHGPFCPKCRRRVARQVLPTCVCRALVTEWCASTPWQVSFGPQLPDGQVEQPPREGAQTRNAQGSSDAEKLENDLIRDLETTDTPEQPFFSFGAPVESLRPSDGDDRPRVEASHTAGRNVQAAPAVASSAASQVREPTLSDARGGGGSSGGPSSTSSSGPFFSFDAPVDSLRQDGAPLRNSAGAPMASQPSPTPPEKVRSKEAVSSLVAETKGNATGVSVAVGAGPQKLPSKPGPSKSAARVGFITPALQAKVFGRRIVASAETTGAKDVADATEELAAMGAGKMAAAATPNAVAADTSACAGNDGETAPPQATETSGAGEGERAADENEEEDEPNFKRRRVLPGSILRRRRVLSAESLAGPAEEGDSSEGGER